MEKLCTDTDIFIGIANNSYVSVLGFNTKGVRFNTNTIKEQNALSSNDETSDLKRKGITLTLTLQSCKSLAIFHTKV